MARRRKITLARLDVVAHLLAQHDDTLLICGLGNTCWDVRTVSDRDEHFYLWGGMGGAAMIGLGLALAQPARRVLVITGDGEMLMGMGSLATIAVSKPKNLAIIVLDNERYGETGMQVTHTHHDTSLAEVARASGISASRVVYTRKELETATPKIFTGHGPTFTNVKVTETAGRTVLPPRHGTLLKDRFRSAVLGNDATTE
jgi:thiamine pyrophosphate-dependent acetolactate synthase large subunit-like protein